MLNDIKKLDVSQDDVSLQEMESFDDNYDI